MFNVDNVVLQFKVRNLIGEKCITAGQYQTDHGPTSYYRFEPALVNYTAEISPLCLPTKDDELPVGTMCYITGTVHSSLWAQCVPPSLPVGTVCSSLPPFGHSSSLWAQYVPPSPWAQVFLFPSLAAQYVPPSPWAQSVILQIN